jgi:hypothetical protein
MPAHRTPYSGLLPTGIMLALCILLTGCPSPYEWRHENQWDSREQIGMAEASQVKLRAAQSRVFDTNDTRSILEAVVSTMQDLNFKVQVLDEELGVVSGKLLTTVERPDGYYFYIPYINYNDQALLLFSRNFIGWGPFWHRSDLVRLTVTVRKRNEKQSVVRASAQFYLQAVENPETYQMFFHTLERSLFLEGRTDQGPG